MPTFARARLSKLLDTSVNPQEGQVASWSATAQSYEPRDSGAGGGPHAASHQNNGGDEISVTGLSGLLADPQTPASHTHTAEIDAAVAAHVALADPHAVYQRESEKAQANGYASLGADGKVPAAQLPASGGGSDPWTVVRLGSDFTTTGTANAAIAGLTFTPAANLRYLVQAYLLMRTATATVGPRPGFSWPGGITDGGAYLQVPNSATAFGFRSWGPKNTQNAASTGVPDTTNSHLATGEAYLVMGAAPSGTFGVTLASETAGTTVTIKAGSFLMYREIP